MNATKQKDDGALIKQLLIVDDEENMRHMLAAMFRGSPYQVDLAADGREALQMIEKTLYDVILCDIKMPNMDGIEFLKSAGAWLEATTVIMMSAYGTIDTAVEAMKLGAYDFISKPFKADEIRLIFQKAEEREKLKRENLQLKKRIQKIQDNFRFYNMVGSSGAIQSVFKLAEKVSRYNTTVLIVGESGTGKELVAKGIHFSGDRAGEPFVPVNCGGIPENLLESELFGHKKGAFTGADRDRKGLFEEAHGGTILLDEIGEMPPTLQIKLLRVLQENEVRPVGASKTQKIDVRVIAATAKDLEDEIRRGNFREDLFYRLNVIRVEVPPLRDRTEDIPLLTHYFIDLFNGKFEKNIKGVSTEAMSQLLNYAWPGNVRELENTIERAVLLSEEKVLQPDSLKPATGGQHVAGENDNTYDGFSIRIARELMEKRLIAKALKETGGNRTHAAKMLEISHPSLLSKMKAYDIDS